MVSNELREKVIRHLQTVPRPQNFATLEEAYNAGIRLAIEARLRVDGEDVPIPKELEEKLARLEER